MVKIGNVCNLKYENIKYSYVNRIIYIKELRNVYIFILI